MYFNFALNFNMALSSADNPFKQFGPRSGPTFCPDLIEVKLFDTLEAMTSWSWTIVFYFSLNLYMTLSSADNSFKQFGPRSGPTFCLDLIGVKLFDTLEVMTSWSWTDVFNYALNFYMTLSSADNPFKQFGPRSGPTICPDLIGVKTLRHFRGYDKLKLNWCILTLS